MTIGTARFLLTLGFFIACSVNAAELSDSTRQPVASAGSSRAIISSISEVSAGRYRIIGTVVNANNNPACGLALASGRCVFSCGPGSPRCEGGTDSLPLGQFDLTNLPTESNGTISLQIFVAGDIPGLQVINPKNQGNYTLMVTTAGNGFGSVTGAGNYSAGDIVTLGAYPDNSSIFQGWSPSPCAASFAMPAYNLTCTATFSQATQPTYTVTLNMTGSGTGTVSGGGTYKAGDGVNLSAIPASGSTFLGWSPSPCAASFAMPAYNLTCTAAFSLVEQPTYTVTLNTTGSGTGTVSGGGTYKAGEQVKLTAAPSFCGPPPSNFGGWSPWPCADNFTMPAHNLVCTATFIAVTRLGCGLPAT